MISVFPSIFFPLAIFNALLAPIFIWIGHKFWTKSDSIALRYVTGAAIGLFFLLSTSVCRPSVDMSLEGIVAQWSLLIVYGLAIISYVFGGLALAKIYKQRSPEHAFS